MSRQIKQPTPYTPQQNILSSRARYRVVACGRRFGKTELGMQAIIRAALDGAVCWWLSPTQSMSNDVWRELRHRLRLNTRQISETERRIVLEKGGGVVSVRSTHTPEYLRGAGLDFVVFDEAAFMEPGVWAEVVRPMLLTTRGRALFLSTPYGQNWFFNVYQLGNDPATPEWAAFHYPSACSPLVSAAELAQIRQETPERIYRAEYLAEFVSDAGQVFRGIADATQPPDTPPSLPQAGRRYVMGVDWGRDGDFTALAVIDAERGELVALDRFNQIGYYLQRDRLAALARHWNVAAIWAEANSIGTPNIEALQQEGLPVRPFMTTARSKPTLIESLSIAIERRELTLLADPVLLGELAAYTVERLPGGGFRYTAPAGAHDDTVIALALAWYGASQGNALLSFA